MSIVRFSVVPAAYVYLRRGDRILLQRRQNTGYMDDMWVAGDAEAGEQVQLAYSETLKDEPFIGRHRIRKRVQVEPSDFGALVRLHDPGVLASDAPPHSTEATCTKSDCNARRGSRTPEC